MWCYLVYNTNIMVMDKSKAHKQTVTIVAIVATVAVIAFWFLFSPINLLGSLLESAFESDDSDLSISVSDQIVQYLSGKYSTDFEYVAPNMGLPFGQHGAMYKSSSVDGEISVRYDKSGDKVTNIRDNYMVVKYEKQTREFLESQAERYFDEVTVFYDVASKAVANNFNKNTSFETFIRDESNSISAYVAIDATGFVRESDMLVVAQNIESGIGAEYLSIIIVVLDSGVYRNVDEETVGRKIGARDFVKCLRLTREDGEVEYEWL